MAVASILNIAVSYSATAALTRTATLAIGAENADRWVIPVVDMVSGSVIREITACTVNGVDAFLANSAATNSLNSGTKLTTFYGKPVYVPSGTTADIAITADKNWSRVFITAFAVTGITALSTRVLASKAAIDTNASGLTINTPELGLVLASLLADGAPTYTFSGVDASPVYDSGTLASSQARLAHRSYTNHAAETGHAIAAPLNAAQINLLSAAAYTYDNNSTTPSTVTVTNLDQNRVVQRIPGTRAAKLRVKATYTGTVANTPTKVQARVMRGSTEVVTWTDLTNATIAGGNIEGDLSGIPVGLVGYSLEVRTYAGTTLLATAAGTTTWCVGDLVAIAGSSTANQFGSADASTEAAPANVYVTSGGSWAGGANLSGACRAMGNRLIANDPTVPIGFLAYGVTGSRLEEWVQTDNALRLALTDYVTKKCDGIVAAVIVPFLETDSVPDQATDVGRFRTLIGQFRTTFNQPNLPAFLNVGGPLDPANGNEARNYLHGQATIQMQGDANVTVGCFRDGALSADGVHMTNASVELMGRRQGAQMVVVLRGVARPYRPPQATSVTYDAATGAAIVTFDLKGGDSLVGRTSQSNITSFRASLDGFTTLLTISSAVIVAPNQVRLVIAEMPATAPAIDYAFGRSPDLSNGLGLNASIAA